MSHNSPIIKAKRKGIPLDIKIQILDRLATGQGATSVGKHFGLHEATVRTIKKNEAAIRKSLYSGTKLSVTSSSYTRDIVKEKMEKALVVWIEDKSQKKEPIDGNSIKQTALKMYRQIKEMEPGTSSVLKKKYEFSASTGWMTGFLKRHTYHNMKTKGKTASADESNTKKCMYTPELVWNADKNGLFWKIMSNKTIVLETPDSKEHNDKDEEDLVLNADLIREGLELASKLGNHFVKHDSNKERTGKFQRDLASLMSSYRKLYNGLAKTQTQRLITAEFVLKSSETPQQTSPNFVQEITERISPMYHEDYNQYISSESVLHKRMRLLSESDSE